MNTYMSALSIALSNTLYQQAVVNPLKEWYICMNVSEEHHLCSAIVFCKLFNSI